MKIKANCDYSISLIRLIATSCIVTCHIMQYLNMELAWWFNVGVQIFLCMSGYLYGKRDTIRDDLNFYRKTLIKILVDYYVVIVPALAVFALRMPEELSPMTAVNVLFTYGTLKGGEHLWYIPYCLFCYWITPFLSRYFENSRHVFIRFLVLSILAIYITETFLTYFESAWIFCYILGFYLGRISNCEKPGVYCGVSLLVVTVAILFNSIQITNNYISRLPLPEVIASHYWSFCNYAHVFLGAALFIIFKTVFSGIFRKGYPNFIKMLCSCSDRYSYDVYLVHQFVILGPFSLMAFTNNIRLNLGLIMAAIAAGAVIVNFISVCIKNRIAAPGSN